MAFFMGAPLDVAPGRTAKLYGKPGTDHGFPHGRKPGSVPGFQSVSAASTIAETRRAAHSARPVTADGVMPRSWARSTKPCTTEAPAGARRTASTLPSAAEPRISADLSHE